MLTTLHSNRLERLADRLCQRLRGGAGERSPFEPELVVVQNPGMARWLSLEIADRLGITANIQFRLPAAFIWRVLGNTHEESIFQRDVMAWRIMARLPELAPEQGFESVASYLAGDTDRGCFELSREIAGAFDQYLLFRPDWIDRWESGEDEHWQARLWRSLTEQGEDHWLSLRRDFLASVEAGEIAADALPLRASFFGIPALSPGYLETIRQLSTLMDIDVYQLNPSREFWQDILAQKVVAKRVAEHPEEQPYLETTNPLLASMGRHVQEHIAALQTLDEPSEELFVDPGEDTVLHCLQHDILLLEDRMSTTLPAGDDSVQIHVCHSPKREVEVLRDRLLDLFERYDQLAPSDVIVMTPDINVYAPWIEAVFGTRVRDEGPSLPFSIADRDYRRERPVISAVFRLLEQENSRFTASEVLSLLDIDAVQGRFRLSPDDVAIIAGWLRESGVRWGWDQQSRQDLGLPENRFNTWSFGLERLFLGYAMPDTPEGVFDSILPCDLVEGGDAKILGRLLGFLDALRAWRKTLQKTQGVNAWAADVLVMLDGFLKPTRVDEPDMDAMRAAIESIRGEVERAGFGEPVSAGVFAARLGQSLESGSLAGRFLAGGITFCGLVPMRSVPFPVVCLLGLGEGEFPRQSLQRDFDLMVGDYRAGDRSRRVDESDHLLLAILSARDHFYVSYTGRDNRDDTEIPASPLVSEMLDYLAGAFGGVEHFLTIHPLQAFSRRYFEGNCEGLFSFSREMFEAARAAQNPIPLASPFMDAPLPAPEPDPHSASLGDLSRFLADTSRFLLREGLEIVFHREESVVEDHEPFEMDTLTANSLRNDLMQAAEAGQDPALLVQVAGGTGRLPHAPLGERIALQEVEHIAALRAQLQSWEDMRLPPRDVEIQVGDWTVTGRFGDRELLTPRGLVGWFGSDKVWINQRVEIWLSHLLLNVASFPDVEPYSRWYYPGKGAMELSPIDGAAEIVSTILGLYRAGRRDGVPFFPRTAWAAAAAPRDPVADAERKLFPQEAVFVAGWRPEGELERAEYGLVFRDREVDIEEVVAVAKKIFGPMAEQLPRSWR